MDEFLDGAVEGNIRLLPDLLRGLNREEKVLRGQVSQPAGLIQSRQVISHSSLMHNLTKLLVWCGLLMS